MNFLKVPPKTVTYQAQFSDSAITHLVAKYDSIINIKGVEGVNFKDQCVYLSVSSRDTGKILEDIQVTITNILGNVEE